MSALTPAELRAVAARCDEDFAHHVGFFSRNPSQIFTEARIGMAANCATVAARLRKQADAAELADALQAIPLSLGSARMLVDYYARRGADDLGAGEVEKLLQAAQTLAALVATGDA